MGRHRQEVLCEAVTKGRCPKGARFGGRPFASVVSAIAGELQREFLQCLAGMRTLAYDVVEDSCGGGITVSKPVSFWSSGTLIRDDINGEAGIA